MSFCNTLATRAPFPSTMKLCFPIRHFHHHFFPGVQPRPRTLPPLSRKLHVIQSSTSSPSPATQSESQITEDVVEQLLSSPATATITARMERKTSASGCGRWFPYLDRFRVGDVSLSSEEVLEALGMHLSDARKDRLRKVAGSRSYSICLVVEGLSDFGNASAAFRSADALGVQSVHVVSDDSSKRYKETRNVSMGAEKWLDIELWDSTSECFDHLRSRGYRIATTHMGSDAVSICDINWSHPTAIVVGNEGRGISKEALELSDLQCSIPMSGMVDSFNVSVAAGIIMHHAVHDRNLRLGSHGDLTSEERQILLAEFFLRHSEAASSIVIEYAKRKGMVARL
ncbi:tRNA (guanosine(18)-2'-O)-methyltransferase-like protein [Drosera capensis]